MKVGIINFNDLTFESQSEYRKWENCGFYEGEPAPKIVLKKGRFIFDYDDLKEGRKKKKKS